MRGTRKILLQVLMVITIITGYLCANPTTAGTIIQPREMSIKINSETIATSDIGNSITVSAIHSIETTPTISRTISTNIETSANFSHQIVNKGNTTENIIIDIVNINNNWNYQYILDENSDGIKQDLENNILNSPIELAPQTTINIFLSLTPNIMSSLATGLEISLNNTAFTYTGFNSYSYGGLDLAIISDNIKYTGASTPNITPIDPLANDTNISPEQEIVLEISDDVVGILYNSIDIWINNQLAIASGNFTAGFSGINSATTNITNGYRVTIDPISLLPINTEVSITVNAKNDYYTTKIYNYSFNTQDISHISLQLVALLQGYYQTETDTMLNTDVNIEFRKQRNIPATDSFTIALNEHGTSEVINLSEILPGDYYLYIEHFNHINVITNEMLSFSESSITVNIADVTSPYFKTIFLSPQAQNSPTALKIESNGKYVIRGGDYNNDNTINIVDWAAFDFEWKSSGNIADFDGNGIIDTRDYGIWLSNNQCYLPLEE